VATYRAVIGLDVERAEFNIATDLDREVVEAALLQKPEWCPIPWPRISEPTDRDLRRLALLKLSIFFDFAAKLPAGTGQEIRQALWQRFPAVRTALAEAGGVRFKRFPVHATIWSDGESNGGYHHPSEGEHPPIGTVTEETLDLFIQNLVRADIRDRLAAQEDPWPLSF
jgi:hypothetical protein